MVKSLFLSLKEGARTFEEDENRILNIKKDIKGKDVTLDELYLHLQTLKLDHWKQG